MLNKECEGFRTILFSMVPKEQNNSKKEIKNKKNKLRKFEK